ncbi:hypothetical protein [Mesorhizobium sp. ES1-1]|uniref:hypothetical protein n=1 Tax=Mesorhizobium sp. ES1-1 TaxID=2876629 RepID=UPI001CCA9120|nr:hypothetical protein [Mesorhizobium sp. ES1-1]MBZ9675298.1 hypothetical protein [Mesorhizobium sp. ES1-1]
MSRVFAYLIRFAVILFGYLVASLAASAFLNILFLASLGYSPQHDQPMAASLYVSIPVLALFVAYFALLPACIIILIAEIVGWRDWLFYALAGAVVAGAFLGMVDHAGDTTFAIRETNAIMAVIGGGMVGGIFYWLSAGRLAGSWWRGEPGFDDRGRPG